MPEVNVRDCYIHLLDGYKLTVQVRPLQLASDLMSIIATQLKLKDKECFGLYYEVSGEYQYWLEPGRPVVEQVPGADIDIIILHFGAMLYHENFKHLQDGVAIGLYYIQCQQLVAKNLIQCQHHTLIKLTSLVLQAQMGDFTTEQVAIEGLKEIKYLPSSFSSTEYEEYEEDILAQYRQLIGIQRKDARMTYLEIVQELPSYGMHFYDVKDRNDVQKLIGIGLYGISQFNIEYRNRPEQVYLWTGISKISSRDNKFILEFRNQALDLDKLLVDENVINTTSQCLSIMSAVQSWYSDSHQLIRVMEQMAATQLNYFEKRKKFRVGIRLYSSYSSSTSSISSIGSITHSSSACTQKSDNSISSMETTQAIRMASKERYSALKIRKEELEKVIEEKEAELRRIKLEEAKLTGITPNDLTEEERASLPKKVSTSYTLPIDFLKSTQQEVSNSSVLGDSENDKELKRLSRAFEVQCNIVKAEYKIYKGHYTSKRIKKQRKKNYKSSEKKLKELEKELEKRRDSLGIAFRQSRFYSGVDEKDTFQWEVTKSFTLPNKTNALSVVDENKIAQHAPNKKGARHSTDLRVKIDPPLLKVRPKHSNTSYAKRSNASDSVSTASPMDGSSFLSLYSRDSSSHLSSGSISSDESRCISCPATEKCIRKQAALKNERQKRVSQHLDLALPERAIKEKKTETIDNLNLDITNQVIFKPPTHYPEPLQASLPFSASIHSAKDFYTKSLPLEYCPADTNTYGKYQYTSDQISKQQYQQKLVYTQQNTKCTNRSPSPRVTAANTKYPLPYMRVNSVPHGLHSSRSPIHDQIIPSQLRSDLAHSQTLVTPSYTSHTLDRYPYHYGGTHIDTNGVMKPAVPITRMHTSPNNITTLEYTKPTHYPQNTSPKLKSKNIPPKVYHKPDLRIPTVPGQYQPHIHTHNPASNMYTNPPVCQIQITPPEGQQYCIAQSRYTTPYNYQSTSEDRYIPNQYHQQQQQPQQPQQQHHQQQQPQHHQQQQPQQQLHQQQQQQPQQQHQRPSFLKAKSHDPLSFTTSLPMPQQVSPNIKCKIDYWEQHTAVNSRPNSIHSSKSLEKIAKQSYTPTETNITPVVVKSRSFRNTFAFENSTLSDEGTPV